MWLTILGMIISAIVSSIISVILSDKVLFVLNRLFVRLGISRTSNITGLWKATFVMGHGKSKKEFVEIIMIKNDLVQYMVI